MNDREKLLLDRISSCEKSAKKIANDETRVLEDSDIPVGKHIWQGDLALIRLAQVPDNAKSQKNRTVRQLVEGNTRGSRHCVAIESMKNVNWYTPTDKGVLVGDVLDIDAPVEIQHPEHGNIVLPTGTYLVKYQRAYSPLQELKRQRD
ncbi:MAG: hypothetical protein ACREBJ_04215 [Nitrosotalea sp.]